MCVTWCLPYSGELSCLQLCDKMSYLATRVSILSNTTQPAKCPKYSAPLSALEAAGWKHSLSKVQRGGKENGKRKS